MWAKMFQAVGNGIYQAIKQYSARLLSFFGAGILMVSVLFFEVLPAGFEWFWDLIPEALSGQLAVFAGAFVFANYWFPVAELFVILIAMWSFLISFIVIKLFVKIFLPTLG